jgi:sec-independent protein translocase protein TatA
MSGLLLFLNLGGSELFLIILVAVMFFGADKIPEIARGLGKGIREVKDAANGIQNEIEKGARDVKKNSGLDDINKTLKE